MSKRSTLLVLGLIAALSVAAMAAIAMFAARASSPLTEVLAMHDGAESPAASSVADPFIELDAIEAPQEPSEETRVEAAVGAPSPEPVRAKGEFDFSDLAPVAARVINEVSDEPLYETLCSVTDQNGVVVEAATDSEGHLRSDELLVKGPVVLKYTRPDTLLFEAVGESSMARAIGQFEHGESSVVWKAPLPRYVGLLVEGTVVPDGEVYVTLVSDADHKDDAAVGRVQSANEQHRMFAFQVQKKEGPRAVAWSMRRIGEPSPDRKLLAMTIKEGVIYVAEAAVPIVPQWQAEAIKLTFLPLPDRDPEIIAQGFSRKTEAVIKAHLLALQRRQELEVMGFGSIKGVVTSASGSYHGRTRVIASATSRRLVGEAPFPRGETLVEWAEGADGLWEGRFEISEMALTQYRVDVRPEPGVYIDPSAVQVVAPHEFFAGTLTVADDLEVADVLLSPPAVGANGYGATLRFDFGGRTFAREMYVPAQASQGGSMLSTNVPYSFKLPVPLGADFKVIVGYDIRAKTFTSSDFTLIDGAWHGDFKLD